MNNYNKTELVLDGLDVEGLYLQDVFSIWQHYDRNGSAYFTVFMIDNSRITVAASPFNTNMLAKGGHGICEFVLVDGVVREMELTAFPSRADQPSADQPSQASANGLNDALLNDERAIVSSMRV